MSMNIHGPSTAQFAKLRPRFSGDSLDTFRSNLVQRRQEKINYLLNNPMLTIGGYAITGRDFLLAIKDGMLRYNAQRGRLSKLLCGAEKLPIELLYKSLGPLNDKEQTMVKEVIRNQLYDLELVNFSAMHMLDVDDVRLTPAGEWALLNSTPKSDR